jgi:Uma2 family endonuclease
MAATTHLMSWESFEKLPDDAMHRELIEGELQVLPPPKSGHITVAKRIYDALVPAQVNGTAYFEAGYKLSSDPATWVQPDVSFVRIERVRTTAPADYFTGAPDLAVEIVSPSESAADLDRKVQLMLRSGSMAVWVVYPQQREVTVHRPDRTSHRLTAAESLSLPELLPGWEFPVLRLFED